MAWPLGAYILAFNCCFKVQLPVCHKKLKWAKQTIMSRDRRRTEKIAVMKVCAKQDATLVRVQTSTHGIAMWQVAKTLQSLYS